MWWHGVRAIAAITNNLQEFEDEGAPETSQHDKHVVTLLA